MNLRETVYGKASEIVSTDGTGNYYITYMTYDK